MNWTGGQRSGAMARRGPETAKQREFFAAKHGRALHRSGDGGGRSRRASRGAQESVEIVESPVVKTEPSGATFDPTARRPQTVHPRKTAESIVFIDNGSRRKPPPTEAESSQQLSQLKREAPDSPMGSANGHADSPHPPFKRHRPQDHEDNGSRNSGHSSKGAQPNLRSSGSQNSFPLSQNAHSTPSNLSSVAVALSRGKGTDRPALHRSNATSSLSLSTRPSPARASFWGDDEQNRSDLSDAWSSTSGNVTRAWRPKLERTSSMSPVAATNTRDKLSTSNLKSESDHSCLLGHNQPFRVRNSSPLPGQGTRKEKERVLYDSDGDELDMTFCPPPIPILPTAPDADDAVFEAGWISARHVAETPTKGTSTNVATPGSGSDEVHEERAESKESQEERIARLETMVSSLKLQLAFLQEDQRETTALIHDLLSQKDAKITTDKSTDTTPQKVDAECQTESEAAVEDHGRGVATVVDVAAANDKATSGSGDQAPPDVHLEDVDGGDRVPTDVKSGSILSDILREEFSTADAMDVDRDDLAACLNPPAVREKPEINSSVALMDSQVNGPDTGSPNATSESGPKAQSQDEIQSQVVVSIRQEIIERIVSLEVEVEDSETNQSLPVQPPPADDAGKDARAVLVEEESSASPLINPPALGECQNVDESVVDESNKGVTLGESVERRKSQKSADDVLDGNDASSTQPAGSQGDTLRPCATHRVESEIGLGSCHDVMGQLDKDQSEGLVSASGSASCTGRDLHSSRRNSEAERFLIASSYRTCSSTSAEPAGKPSNLGAEVLNTDAGKDSHGDLHHHSEMDHSAEKVPEILTSTPPRSAGFGRGGAPIRSSSPLLSIFSPPVEEEREDLTLDSEEVSSPL
ncbi:hypothetical protein M427DRAFT_66902 [Gonapodya prolifera JEL478]|uniref:Uncharacterized protein n=1 Tax=Gonapodya prolifera (strain JEL478) TaxID=1344416 RepID=A0A139ASS8_GONPJ|nr:hypothetical protein M427DRAFT_66902 [Gonapodya prolifera JEL478]|eukprot:KXS19769.1 hypothetical protein M427DRAFT_66902 [Gonapodya prolifera JEL478]